MASREVTLESAAFLESAPALGLAAVPVDARRTIIESFLHCLFDELGKAPRHLDGDDLHAILGHLLPGHFGKRDARASHVLPVLRAYLEFLETRAIVSQGYELRQALAANIGHFEEAVRTGTPHVHGHAHGPAEKGVPFVHKADKTGRNDPCPCGSGKKFKQCCLKLTPG